MTTTMTTDLMSSDVTPHTATRVREDVWVVTWLPERELTEEQAQAAMNAAELVWTGPEAGSAKWTRLNRYADQMELAVTSGRTVRWLAGMTPGEARAFVALGQMSYLQGARRAELYCPACDHADWTTGCTCRDLDCACGSPR